jgi:hypothetical protein
MKPEETAHVVVVLRARSIRWGEVAGVRWGHRNSKNPKMCVTKHE